MFVQKYYGMSETDVFDRVGANLKMTEFQAAMGICNLKHIDNEIKKRSFAAKRYIERLNNVSGLKIWKEQENVLHNYAYFPVFFDKNKFGKSRDEVLVELAHNDIFARKYFYPITSEFECYQNFNINDTPVAKQLSDSVLTLPLYADLTVEDVDLICDIILKQ